MGVEDVLLERLLETLLDRLDALLRLLTTLDLEDDDDFTEDVAEERLVEVTLELDDRLLTTELRLDFEELDEMTTVDEREIDEMVDDEAAIELDENITELTAPEPFGSELPPPPQAVTIETNAAVPKKFNRALKIFIMVTFQLTNGVEINACIEESGLYISP
jgi:hypothetical protein